ncbi:hypothetical protein KHC33_13755 [Methanospirillum sp. J.3.6.1-F.2.7.3]|uniref:SMP-30/Gluconolactonase/LRE-like region domain-containing protein n=2 Tax=Methanospirillum TaxID=2202 RepID=A0A8E7EIR4_9EURY|nr:hypothetical protein KHC33_13755 [Methanospirillum sp. J.3.6.1-F.2.7.3]QXO94253.1 hypothetical protein KSK55_13095 [Methanospirillum hungatei]
MKRTYIRKCGGEGSEPGQFDIPIGIWVDSEGDVYVADSGSPRYE